MRVALGAVPGPKGPFPSIHSLYQQLHNYQSELPARSGRTIPKATSTTSLPCARISRRPCACIVLDGNPDLEHRIQVSLSTTNSARYGLPFLGDNAFLIDRLEAREIPPVSHWYCHLHHDDVSGSIPHTTRLTIWIDRQDMSKTRSALFAPRQDATAEIPVEAWTTIEPPQASPPPGKTPKKRGNS